MTRTAIVFALLLASLASFPPAAQAQSFGAAFPSTASGGPLPTPRTAEDVYRAACVTCHGEDGTGSSRAVVGFNVPLPDFTDCAFATAEPDADWQAVVHEGGRVRGLDHHMPSFGEALTHDDIVLAVSHLRTFCKEPAWPRGDLNLPRAFFTEKAFPESEVVWSTAMSHRDGRAIGNEFTYEKRLGARNQFELLVPIDLQHTTNGPTVRGLGDVAMAFRRTLYASVATGSIGAAGVEVAFPTGKESIGLGNGYGIVEPFAMWGQILPRNFFLQFHGGVELPADTTLGAKEAYLRGAIGTTFAENRGFGRAWSPQVEVLWARPWAGSSEWDVVPQLQVTLSKLQHVSVAAGVRIPVNERGERPAQGLVYLLWDFFDGGFFEFWK